MLKNLKITNFKCIAEADLDLTPLTIITGKNSSGKSTVLQAVLLLARNCNQDNTKPMWSLVSKFSEPKEVLNNNKKDKQIKIEAEFTDEEKIKLQSAKNSFIPETFTKKLKNESQLWYLSGNRNGQQDTGSYSPEYKIGDTGEFIFGAYQQIYKNTIDSNVKVNKDNIIKVLNSGRDSISMFQPFMDNVRNFIKEIYSQIKKEPNAGVRNEALDSQLNMFGDTVLGIDMLCRVLLPESDKKYSGHTVFVQLNYWLSYISETVSALVTTKSKTDEVGVSFVSNGIREINPFNLGTGMSYLVKVLIVSFMAKKGDLVMIENPEVHLHPKAQARLGEFFAFMASKGIQFILETHCEHLINNVRYQVYKKNIKSEDVAIYYKPDAQEPFQYIGIGTDGYYQDKDKNAISFPKDFFDVSVKELMELGL